MFISIEYPASLLREWKTSPVTVNDNMIYQFHFWLLTSAQLNLIRVIVYFNGTWSGGANIPRCLQRGAPAQL